MSTIRMELLTSIEDLLRLIYVPHEIPPESIRPLAVQSRDRKTLGELERELQKNLEALKEDDRLPHVLYLLGNLHLYESDFGRAVLLYEISLGLNSEQVSAWINMGSMISDFMMTH